MKNVEGFGDADLQQSFIVKWPFVMVLRYLLQMSFSQRHLHAMPRA